MRLDKLTTNLQLVLADAQSLAVGREHQYIEPVHLAHILLNQDNATLPHVLSNADIDQNKLGNKIIKALDSLPKVSGLASDVHINRDLDQLLNAMDKIAQDRNDGFIASELFAILAIDDNGKLGAIFRQCGADKNKLNNAIDAVRGGEKVNAVNAE